MIRQLWNGCSTGIVIAFVLGLDLEAGSSLLLAVSITLAMVVGALYLSKIGGRG